MLWTFLIVCIGLASAYETVHPQRLMELRDAGNYEEYARLLGVDNVDLVRPSNDERSEFIDMRSKPVSALGDIMLTKEQSEQARLYINYTTYTTYKWRNCSMYYWIVESDFDPEQIPVIKNAIEELNKRMPFLKLLAYPETTTVDDFIYFFNGQGCWSYLGRRGGAQPVSLQKNGCVWKSTVMHEVIHAAGAHHEQNRYDRDEYIEMLWDNIPEEWHDQYQKTNRDVFVSSHSYDYYSIMHYPVRAPGTNKRAFNVKKNGIDEERIGQAEYPSELDIIKMNDAYRQCDV